VSALRQVRIDPVRISENAAVLLRRAASTKTLLAMDVSADAFGHGAVVVARAAMAGGASLFVARDAATIAQLTRAGIAVAADGDLPFGAMVLADELYGFVPDAELRPAMRVTAVVAGIKTIAAGEGVSYGYTYRAARQTTLALIGIGYADGLDRRASNTAHIWLGTKLRLVAGRVAMNAVMLEMGDDTAEVGDEAVLFGDPSAGEPHISLWAASLRISAREAAITFSSRINHPLADSADPVDSAALATIDLDSYRHNLSLVRSRVAPSAVMAVVKADAYGHGLVAMARAASSAGIRQIGTLDIKSAVALRDSGIDGLLFTWLLAPTDDFAGAISRQIDLGVSSRSQLDQIAAFADALAIPARVHLKIDTGLHRNGLNAAEWPSVVSRALELQAEGTVALIGAWTHISEASFDDDSAAIRLFEVALKQAAELGATFELRHLAASAASFERADARYDLVRIGAFGYGIAPGDGVGPAELGLKPVMTLTAPVIAVSEAGVNAIANADAAGSNASTKSVRVGIGFADGISSRSAGIVEVMLSGSRFTVLAVECDHLVIEAPDAELGDTVTVFGCPSAGAPTLQEWADATGTIGEEIVTRLSSRIPRKYVKTR
jgi:alanine racemase